MHQLDVVPEEHFAETDYAGSEVLIYRWDSDPGQVLMCCLDLSEKIAGWAYGTRRPDYASRYRIFCFLGVGGYRRSNAAESWRPVQDDFLITRQDRRVPIDDITISRTDDAHTVAISFELGFGKASFNCREVTIFELTSHAVAEADGTNRYVTDADMPFDEDGFLSNVYRLNPDGDRPTH